MRWTRRLIGLMPMVAVLAGAVALMHSLPAEADRARPAAAMTQPHAECCPTPMAPAAGISNGDDPQPMPGHGSHGLTHLCLAILAGAVAGVFGLALHLRRRAPQLHDATDNRQGEPAPARPPPLAGRTLLNTLCILRA